MHAYEYFRAQPCAFAHLSCRGSYARAFARPGMTKMSATIIDHSCALNSIKIPGKLGKFQFRDTLSRSGCQRISISRALACITAFRTDIIKRRISVVVAIRKLQVHSEQVGHAIGSRIGLCRLRRASRATLSSPSRAFTH